MVAPWCPFRPTMLLVLHVLMACSQLLVAPALVLLRMHPTRPFQPREQHMLVAHRPGTSLLQTHC